MKWVELAEEENPESFNANLARHMRDDWLKHESQNGNPEWEAMSDAEKAAHEKHLFNYDPQSDPLGKEQRKIIVTPEAELRSREGAQYKLTRTYTDARGDAESSHLVAREWRGAQPRAWEV